MAAEDADKVNAGFLTMSHDDELQMLKDQLFIDTGEDVEDIFLAFKIYKLQ